MQRVFRIIFSLLVLITMLSACSTMMQKNEKRYKYIPPQSRADKRCIGKCMHARKYCLQICELKKRKYCDCTTSFNTCYSACGGQVYERK